MKRANGLESSSHLWRPRRGETALEEGRLLPRGTGISPNCHWTEEEIEKWVSLYVLAPVLRSVVDNLRRGVDHVVRPGSRTSSAEDRLAGG